MPHSSDPFGRPMPRRWIGRSRHRGVGPAALLLAVLLAILPASQDAAATEPLKSLPWIETAAFDHGDQTGVDLTRSSLVDHARRQTGSVGSASAIDVGDVWVVAANSDLLYRYHRPFDLPTPTTLRFTPEDGGASFAVERSRREPHPDVIARDAVDLDLGDDDTTEVEFAAGFPYFGTRYASVWVNSDGNLTFGEGDAAHTRRNAIRHVGGPPRLSVLLTDFNPECRGSVRAEVQPDRLIVIWDQVVHYVRGAADGCGPSVPDTTVQAVLHADGVIELTYQAVDRDVIGQPGVDREAVIGVAEGDFLGPFNDVDYSDDLPATYATGAIFEEFSSVDASSPPQVDLVRLAQEFYATHDDAYDFLVLFTEQPVTMGEPGAFALNYLIKNETGGLALGSYDFSRFWGSGGELESFLHMNWIDLYWPDAVKLVDPPIKLFSRTCTAREARRGLCDRPPGSEQDSQRARWFGTIDGFGPFTLGLHSAMSLMAEEVGHRWMAYPTFQHQETGEISDDLLGRGWAHWSSFFNTRVPDGQFGGDPRSSSMAGNAIVDLGADPSCPRPRSGLFQHERDELIDGYSALDQYFMGLRDADDVPPFWYVDEPYVPYAPDFSLEQLRFNPPIDDVSYCGRRVDLTVADLQAAIGPRVPADGDEVDEDASGHEVTDVKTMAFILLVSDAQPGSTAHASAIERVDTFRRTWEEYANGPATGGRGRFDTSLDPVVH